VGSDALEQQTVLSRFVTSAPACLFNTSPPSALPSACGDICAALPKLAEERRRRYAGVRRQARRKAKHAGTLPLLRSSASTYLSHKGA